MDPETPIREELSVMGMYHFFAAEFFGGTVYILAKDFAFTVLTES